MHHSTLKCSTFLCTISTEATKLWTGGGTSPSTQCDAFSGRSEGYGILAAITFLEHYITATKLMLPHHPTPITGYCDNNGLVQQVTNMQTDLIPNPAQTIANDYNLTNEIYQTIRRIPIPLTLRHIKGHQDQNSNLADLPKEAQLNVACNEQARDNLESFPINFKPHPSLPATSPHLRIEQQTIVRQLSAYMQEYARLPAYHHYLTKKFKWPPGTTHQIEWQTIELMLRCLTPPEQT